jgi:hypothetical protein
MAKVTITAAPKVRIFFIFALFLNLFVKTKKQYLCQNAKIGFIVHSKIQAKSSTCYFDAPVFRI